MDARAAVNLLAWSLQVALIVAAAALAARLAAIGSARVRHLWWRGVLVLCLALPLIQPWQATVAPDAAAGLDSGADQAAGAGQAQAGIAPILAMAAASRTAPGMPQWPVLLTVIIGAGGVLRLAWLAAGIRRLRRLRLAGECADRQEVDDVQSLVGARADVRYVPRIQQPVTFGVRRPIVLLPSSLQALTPASRRAVLAHELWHVRRRDWMALLAEEGIRSALWFHPAFWWLISRVQSSR